MGMGKRHGYRASSGVVKITIRNARLKHADRQVYEAVYTENGIPIFYTRGTDPVALADRIRQSYPHALIEVK